MFCAASVRKARVCLDEQPRGAELRKTGIAALHVDILPQTAMLPGAPRLPVRPGVQCARRSAVAVSS